MLFNSDTFIFGFLPITLLGFFLLTTSVPGYHDEPLKGHRAGQRSIRLSRAYRAIYEIKEDLGPMPGCVSNTSCRGLVAIVVVAMIEGDVTILEVIQNFGSTLVVLLLRDETLVEQLPQAPQPFGSVRRRIGLPTVIYIRPACIASRNQLKVVTVF